MLLAEVLERNNLVLNLCWAGNAIPASEHRKASEEFRHKGERYERHRSKEVRSSPMLLPGFTRSGVL